MDDTPVHVNQSLSRGLADQAFAALERQRVRYRNGIEASLRQRVRSKKAVARTTRALQQLGERLCLIQTIGRSPNARHVSIGQFVPCVASADGHRRAEFMLQSLALSTAGVRPGPDAGRILAAREHAVERLFQRLNTLDLGKATRELHDAMLLSLPLCDVALELDLRQVALPTTSGAFICDVDPGRGCIDARTWLDDESMGERWAPVVAHLRDALAIAGGDDALAVVLSVGLEAARADDDTGLYRNLRAALGPFGWLRQTYLPRPDPVGDRWKRARIAECAVGS
jgi:hypothetical protein